METNNQQAASQMKMGRMCSADGDIGDDRTRENILFRLSALTQLDGE